MKVVLRKDVPTLGRAGDVKDVADGYARNYLIPRGLAAAASRTALENVKAHQEADTRHRARADADHRALADRIEAAPLVVHARTGEQGRLYGSVTSADIAEALSRSVGTAIDKRSITLNETIRTVGPHAAEVRIAPRVTARLAVVVEPEGREPTAGAEAGRPSPAVGPEATRSEAPPPRARRARAAAPEKPASEPGDAEAE